MFIVPITQMPAIKFGEIENNLIENNVVDVNKKASSSFSDILTNAITNAQETQAISSKDAQDLAVGNVDDMHSVMINSEKAATALEFAVQVTGKAVNAYNEISRMQI